jgi:hypothetical protein
MLSLVVATCVLSACVVTVPAEVDPSRPLRKQVHSGESDKIAFFVSLNRSCRVRSYPQVRVRQPPVHGAISTAVGEDYPDYPQGNPRYACNSAVVGSQQLFYQSAPDFHGDDSVVVDVRFPDHRYVVKYDIEVR